MVGRCLPNEECCDVGKALIVSGLPYPDFINAIIDDGEDEVRRNYLRPDQQLKREGCLLGFSECRDKTPEQLMKLHANAKVRTARARTDEAADYWFWRCREAQIEWVLNVLSAALSACDHQPLIPPTQRGLIKATEILGGERF